MARCRWAPFDTDKADTEVRRSRWPATPAKRARRRRARAKTRGATVPTKGAVPSICGVRRWDWRADNRGAEAQAGRGKAGHYCPTGIPSNPTQPPARHAKEYRPPVRRHSAPSRRCCLSSMPAWTSTSTSTLNPQPTTLGPRLLNRGSVRLTAGSSSPIKGPPQ